MNISECQQSTKEDPDKYRTIESYEKIIKEIENMTSVKLKDTKGLKFYCHLNKLNFFHIINNYHADIMHDLCEGTIPFLLDNFFEKCVDAKVFSVDDVTSYMQYFDYGRLNQNNIPTTLSLGSKSLGQNASQMRCLMLHLPFILYDFQSNNYLRELWDCVSSMLEIIMYVYSDDFSKEDLDNLKKAVELHLESVLKFFKKNLLPKHHFMTHYATIVEKVGPIVHKSCMKYESKHKEFTDQTKKTHNFLNIGHTIAKKYQQLATTKTNYGEFVSHAKLKAISINNSCNYFYVCQLYHNSIESVFVTNRVKVNSDVYLKKLFLIYENQLFEINEIFKVNQDFHFLCCQYEILKFELFLNSVKINPVQPIVRIIIKHSELEITKSFERKTIGESEYIILDTVEMLRLKQMYVQ